jgi:ferredoxin, 2Fe-2S
MITVTYIEASGRDTEVQAKSGQTLMQAATAHGVDGIVAECGGSGTCGTCHCYIDPARLDSLPAPSADEQAMLDYVAAERRPNSRLACQVRLTAELDGLVVNLPDRQF